MLAEKFFLVLETLRSFASDGSARVVSTTPHIPVKLPPRSRPSKPTMVISKPICAMASVSAKPNAPISKHAICKAEAARLT
jgi:hypothetical protein